MKKIYFATTNEGKLNEAKSILGLDLIGTPLEVDEIQSLDPSKVAVRKALDYYKNLKKPIFVEDISLSFSALGQLPGPYINDFSNSLGNSGLIELLRNKVNRKALARATVVYVDNAANTYEFIGEIKGSISTKPRGKNGFGWDPIFIPLGEKKTFAEMNLEEKNKYSMRAIALKKFKSWLSSNGY